MDHDYEHRLMQLLDSLVGMQTFDRAVTLAHLLLQTKEVPGAVVEFGVFEGKTAMLLAALTKKRVMLYDSFEGLPEQSEHDAGGRSDLAPGALKETSLAVIQRFTEAHLLKPEIVAAWFGNLCDFELPETISFAHIDADYHDSTMKALELVYPRLSAGAICVMDDYGAAGLPGVKKACDVFMTDKEPIVHPWGINGRSEHAYFVRGSP